MFRDITSQLAGTGATSGDAKTDAKKVLSPTLRPDIYSLIDKTKAWALATTPSSSSGGQAGDGVSYGALLELIQKYLPETKKPGLESFGQAEGEIAVIVGGVTNLILELSKWEGMAAGMAMRTWVDALVDAHARAGEARKKAIATGTTRGLNQYTDAGLLTKDFTTRIQIISCLKTVSARMYGAGTDEARKCEAMWSSKFI
ncbi:unnamed protein product [Cyclocybe aegerita]|uniref:Uncharacterized protein n=1 Tax=Cyclocybe aegerita TaxID=1973307 RepID=A0A8S0XF16_CYCAE|nr:unnamed protein product [Cyclocybe aegerita]